MPDAIEQIGLGARSGNWEALIDGATRFRRWLHQNPEQAWHEVDTAAAVRDGLDQLGIRWRACARTGTVATVAPAAAGKHVALRGDMDALPIAETGDVPWRSRRDGCMHACGHDGHTAVLLATAAWLGRHEHSLPGPVTLLFQPAEEGGHGARHMIDDGALDGVDEIYGWHNWPAIPFGQALCPTGPVMAGNGTFRVVVHGKGGHSSEPEACRDPVLAAAATVVALQQIVARRMRPGSPTVVSVTSIEAPSGPTIIPERATLAGSFRLTDPADRAVLTSAITEISTSTAAAHGVVAEVTVEPRYQPTINAATPARFLQAAIGAELGTDWHASAVTTPIMASEDFSYYLAAIPGAFALVGSGGSEATGEPCHSPRYDFDDRLIPVVTRIFARVGGAPVP